MVPTLTCGLSRSNFSFATLSFSFREAPCRVPATSSGSLSGEPPKDTRYPPRSCPGGDRLAGAMLDDVLGDPTGHLGVAVELHRVGSAPLGRGPEVGRVAEHLRQWDAGLDGHRVAARLLALDPAAATGEIADHVAEELLRQDHLHRHHRLEQDRLGPFGGLLECQ